MSAISKLVPLFLLFVLLGFFAFVGYAIYTIANDVADKTAKKMEKRHLNFTKDGLVVGVKERRDEAYVDRTQRWVYGLVFLFVEVRWKLWTCVQAVGVGVHSSKFQNYARDFYIEWLLTYSFLPHQLLRQGMELQHLACLQIPILEQRHSSTTPSFSRAATTADITSPNSTGITTTSSVIALSTYFPHTPLP